MKEHKIKVEGTGNEEDLISFFEFVIKIIKIAHNNGDETIISNDKMKCTIENV